MSFSDLYQAVQTQGDRISTKWLRARAIEFSHIAKIKEQWSGVIDANVLRGFYIEGPKGGPVPLVANEALIVLARAMCDGAQGDHWRRAVLAKELMHVFDQEDEKTHTREQFDALMHRFGDPAAPLTPQFRAESKAYWRSLAVLCTEKKRLEYRTALEAETISFDVVATALRIPVLNVHDMMSDRFEQYRPNWM
ncbi:hypothetical protein [Bradyrhizobium sp. RP6]|uniref:hypothetical protein n=1 Tax=Bradyrhizobium sp. RP6 TaxID=2489596 RepID=UPI000F528347|nr:hypothetical protein [Bradyrhizobium sp. RP6]RQH15710.1 hypothetical protein EHH60_00485 [Bradyrhizobium sp. RP6]